MKRGRRAACVAADQGFISFWNLQNERILRTKKLGDYPRKKGAVDGKNNSMEKFRAYHFVKGKNGGGVQDRRGRLRFNVRKSSERRLGGGGGPPG